MGIEDGAALTFTIESNDNPALVTPTIDPTDSTLDLSFGVDLSGSATLVLRATDSGALSVDDTLVVTVTPVPAAAPESVVVSAPGPLRVRLWSMSECSL